MAGYDGRGARFNIIAVEGSDLSFTVTAVDSVAAAVDLSAATITGTIYNGAGAVVDTFTDAVSGAGSNVITLSLTDTEVDALVAPKSYALVVTRGSDSRTWLAGSFVVSSADRARNGTSGTAVTATVDTNVIATATVLTAVGGGGSSDAADINIVDSAGYYTATNVETALAEVKVLADAAVTPAEAAAAYQPLAAVLTNTTASFTTTDETKLDGIETAADVTDTTNVTAAGALMDSEVDADIKTLSLPANTTISAFGATIVDDADAAAVITTLGLAGQYVPLASFVTLTPTTGSVNIDLGAVSGDYLTHSLSGNVTYTSSNRAVGAWVVVRVVCDASIRTLGFPAWVFIGAKPSEIAANKTGVLSVTWFGTTEASAVASWAVEE